MVGLLILIQMSDVLRGDIAGPLQVKVDVWLLNHRKTSVFATVHHRVVDVRCVPYFEGHKQVLNVLPVVSPDSITHPVNFYIAWVREERSWWSTFVDALKKVHVFVVRFKHTVWQAGFLTSYEIRVNRVVLQKGVNLLQKESYVT